MEQRDDPIRTSVTVETHYCRHINGEEFIRYDDGELWYTPPIVTAVRVAGYKIYDESDPDWKSGNAPRKHWKLRLNDDRV